VTKLITIYVKEFPEDKELKEICKAGLNRIHIGLESGSDEILKMEQLAKERKIEKLRLQSSINAVDFYEKLGYKKGVQSQSEQYGITYEMSKAL